MTRSELPRPIKVKPLPAGKVEILADEAERAALAERFSLSALHLLKATVSLDTEGAAIVAEGALTAHWAQPCAVSGEDFPLKATEQLNLRFVPAGTEPLTPDEEIELDADDCDEIDYQGDSFDLGEAIAQSFGLMLDPYATGPDADRVRREKGIQIEGEQNGPMADMLAALKKG